MCTCTIYCSSSLCGVGARVRRQGARRPLRSIREGSGNRSRGGACQHLLSQRANRLGEGAHLAFPGKHRRAHGVGPERGEIVTGGRRVAPRRRLRTIDAATVLVELEGRPRSAAARTGYLLQGMRPDVADAIIEKSPPHSKARFGTGTAKRNDERWQVSDAALPFDPREMERVL